MKKEHRYLFPKAAAIAALAFTAINCIWVWGSVGAWENAEIIAAVGSWRYPLAGLLAWLIWIIVMDDRIILLWVYGAAVFLLTGASLCVLRHGGYGYILAIISIKTAQYVGVGGLYLISMILCAAPFLLINRTVLVDRMKGFLKFIESKFYIDTGGVMPLYSKLTFQSRVSRYSLSLTAGTLTPQ